MKDSGERYTPQKADTRRLIILAGILSLWPKNSSKSQHISPQTRTRKRKALKLNVLLRA